MASYRDPELKEERDLETPHMSYARRERSRSKVPGSTMGPIGTVDFDDLVKQSRGMFVDRDFPANDHSVYTDGERSGFGAITRAVNVRPFAALALRDVSTLLCPPVLGNPRRFISSDWHVPSTGQVASSSRV